MSDPGHLRRRGGWFHSQRRPGARWNPILPTYMRSRNPIGLSVILCADRPLRPSGKAFRPGSSPAHASVSGVKHPVTSARHTATPADGSAPNAPSAGSSLNHLPAIDGLRGIAILLVLWYHGPYLLGDTTTPSSSLYSSGSWSSVFWRASIGGWVGVDLFFVISGFLITTILLRTRADTGQLRVFFARRALRILPLAYLYLIVLSFVGVWDGSDKVVAGFDGWAWYACHLGNVLQRWVQVAR